MNDLQRLIMATVVIIATIFSSVLVLKQWFHLQFENNDPISSSTNLHSKAEPAITKVIVISPTPVALLTPSTPSITAVFVASPTKKVLIPSPSPTMTATQHTLPVTQLIPTPTKKPTLIVNNQLPDFSNIVDVKQKKKAFFDYMAPMIEEENNKILTIRARIQTLKNADVLLDSDKQWLEGLKKSYRVKDSANDVFSELLFKVNIIPASLAIAQSANESAWAGSRFAKLGNNLFGQWCFSKGCGVIPEGRPEGETFEVRQFKSPQHSVASYLLNLNRHYAYAKLREVRFELISDERTINGYDLAVGLQSYSIRKMEYVKEIQQMIKYNQLLRFDVSDAEFDAWIYRPAQTVEVKVEPTSTIKATTTPSTLPKTDVEIDKQ
jgi:Bax protein